MENYTVDVGTAVGPAKELKIFVALKKSALLTHLLHLDRSLEKVQLERLRQFQRRLLLSYDTEKPKHINEYIPLNKKLLSKDTRLKFAA